MALEITTRETRETRELKEAQSVQPREEKEISGDLGVGREKERGMF